MIGSSTYIVKQNGNYCAHIGGNTFDFYIIEDAKKKCKTVFQCLSKYVSAWGKADVDGLSYSDVQTIAFATTHNEGSSGYSRWAGDCCYLVDMDAEKVFVRRHKYKDEPAAWKELTTDEE
jgi:hypothetical protein